MNPMYSEFHLMMALGVKNGILFEETRNNRNQDHKGNLSTDVCFLLFFYYLFIFFKYYLEF